MITIQTNLSTLPSLPSLPLLQLAIQVAMAFSVNMRKVVLAQKHKTARAPLDIVPLSTPEALDTPSRAHKVRAELRVQLRAAVRRVTRHRTDRGITVQPSSQDICRLSVGREARLAGRNLS